MKDKLKEYSEAFTDTHKKILGIGIGIILLLVLLRLLSSSSSTETALVAPVLYSNLPQTKEIKINPNAKVNPTAKINPNTSKSINNINLVGNQEKLYNALEASTRAYLSQMVSPTLMKDYNFDPKGKIKLSIAEMFRLSEEALVRQYGNRIINSVTIDTIRSDSLDLRSILYKQ